MSVWVPLSEGSERIGLIELVFDESPTGLTKWGALADVARMMVLILVSGRRYTDVLLRARRAETLSDAAEAQWDLLPPLSYAGTRISVSGILEPAYSIGGDSFDYAINPGRLDLAIVDAVGHGLPAVLMASAAINTLRNARREQRTLEQAYHQVDRRIAEQFGRSYYVTGQIATLDVGNGRLTWLNGGHVLPLLVRNGSFVGEIECAPSMPMGLGGPVVQVAVESLQTGDRVLFHTDGVIESRSSDGSVSAPTGSPNFLAARTHERGHGGRDDSCAVGERGRSRWGGAERRREPLSGRVHEQRSRSIRHSIPTADEHAKRDSPNSTWSSESR